MIREEFKKIWRPWIFIILGILCWFFWTIGMEFFVTYFPNGLENQFCFRQQAEWAQKYGPTLEDDEIEEIYAHLHTLYAEAEKYFAGEPLFQKYNLSTYEEFNSFMEQDKKSQRDDLATMLTYLREHTADDLYLRIYAIEESLRFVDTFKESGKSYWEHMLEKDSGYTRQEYDNAIKLIADTEGWRNILEYQIPTATASYWGVLLALVSLSTIVLIAPLLVRDRANRIRALQWSSRRGRNIIWSQLGAALLSTFLLATVYLLFFGGLFATNKTWLFWNCRMYSFDNLALCWGNWTYGTYCLILTGIYYLVSLASCMLAFLFARFSSNYISLLLKLIPAYVILQSIYNSFALDTFYYSNPLYRLTRVPYIEAITPTLLLLVVAALVMLMCALLKKTELASD